MTCLYAMLCVSSILKAAVITPICKQTPPDSIENGLTPISLTCLIAKLMEGFPLMRIMPSVVNQLDNKQFSMAGKSTHLSIRSTFSVGSS